VIVVQLHDLVTKAAAIVGAIDGATWTESAPQAFAADFAFGLLSRPNSEKLGPVLGSGPELLRVEERGKIVHVDVSAAVDDVDSDWGRWSAESGVSPVALLAFGHAHGHSVKSAVMRHAVGRMTAQRLTRRADCKGHIMNFPGASTMLVRRVLRNGPPRVAGPRGFVDIVMDRR
jgi:hypothetical protein